MYPPHTHTRCTAIDITGLCKGGGGGGGGLLKQGLHWDWTGTGLGLDWEIYSIVHSCESLVALNTSCEHVLQ